MRQSIRDLDERLNPPRVLSLDEMIEYIGPDELVEVTPQSYACVNASWRRMNGYALKRLAKSKRTKTNLN